MPIHKVKITQVSRVERSIIVDVEADSIEDAVIIQADDDAPGADDPRWITQSNSLENEEVIPA